MVRNNNTMDHSGIYESSDFRGTHVNYHRTNKFENLQNSLSQHIDITYINSIDHIDKVDKADYVDQDAFNKKWELINESDNSYNSTSGSIISSSSDSDSKYYEIFGDNKQVEEINDEKNIDDKNTDDKNIENKNMENKNKDNKRNEFSIRGTCGLVNLGNTCFLNSGLQCLNAILPFSGYFIRGKHVRQLKKNILSKDGKSVFDNECEIALYNTVTYHMGIFFKAMWEYNSRIEPRSLKRVIGMKNEMFRGFAQHDAQEALNFILDSIHEDTKRTSMSFKFPDVEKGVVKLINIRDKCSSLVRNPNVSDEEKEKVVEYYKEYRRTHDNDVTILKAYTFWKKYLSKNYSIITDLFTGLFYSRIICDECNTVSSTFEPFTMLSIETKEFGEVTLEECLETFSKEELLNGHNKYNCDVCKKGTTAKKQYFIWEPPSVLIIHLKRFKNEHIHGDRYIQKKTNSLVKFPLSGLKLDKNYSEIHKKDFVYDLRGVSEHMGSCFGGHYIAHCKNYINNKWYEFDDSTVRYVPDADIEGELISKNAYMLFYVRRV